MKEVVRNFFVCVFSMYCVMSIKNLLFKPFIFIDKKLHMVNMSDAIRRNQKENEKKTIAPIRDWKCNFPPFLGN